MNPPEIDDGAGLLIRLPGSDEQIPIEKWVRFLKAAGKWQEPPDPGPIAFFDDPEPE